jgi:hypothetical protein
MRTRTLRRVHNSLLEDLRGLGRAIQPDADANIVEVRARLATTCTHLNEHFHLEEQGGYLDDVQTRQPRLQREVDELGGQHREMLDALGHLRDEAAVASDLDDVLRLKVRTWIDRLLQHEARENDVIQDAVDSDFGGGD